MVGYIQSWQRILRWQLRKLVLRQVELLPMRYYKMASRKMVKCAKKGCNCMVSPTQRYCFHHLREKWSIKAPMLRQYMSMDKINTILYSKGFLGEVQNV